MFHHFHYHCLNQHFHLHFLFFGTAFLRRLFYLFQLPDCYYHHSSSLFHSPKVLRYLIFSSHHVFFSYYLQRYHLSNTRKYTKVGMIQRSHNLPLN
ncbi:unnamed protein product [Brugia timori]|uniref:Uncharacterized protein n=1 Tax=Brugia timori TaxID=42155 RepID=A0A3P7WFV1_9BILA|nr:unnamed protein product [Brugia timori]